MFEYLEWRYRCIIMNWYHKSKVIKRFLMLSSVSQLQCSHFAAPQPMTCQWIIPNPVREWFNDWDNWEIALRQSPLECCVGAVDASMPVWDINWSHETNSRSNVQLCNFNIACFIRATCVLIRWNQLGSPVHLFGNIQEWKLHKHIIFMCSVTHIYVKVNHVFRSLLLLTHKKRQRSGSDLSRALSVHPK